ncbi:MAG: DUF5362 family protein [candidate division WOR-3 bacterium]
MESSITTAVTNSRIRENVRGMKGWLKLLGIVQIVIGILQAVTLLGIIWAWLPIWLGIILNGAANKAQEYLENGDEQALSEFTGKLKLYFIINGIMMIVSLAAAALSLIVVVVLAALGFLSLPGILESLRG